MVMLVTFALGGIFAAQPAAAQSIPNDDFAGSDIKIPVPDILIRLQAVMRALFKSILTQI
jgi:hypothetical protein